MANHNYDSSAFMTSPTSNKTTSQKHPVSSDAVSQVRIVALLVAGAFFVLVGAFVAMVFFVQDEARLNAVGPIAAGPGAERGGLIFHGTANIWEVRGRMVIDANRRVRFGFDLVGPTGQPAPRSLDFYLELDKVERDDVPPMRLTHQVTGPGSYVASADLPSEGRWRLRMVFEEITGVFEFESDG